MRVAVITPYHTEPLDMLKRAHDSVAGQTHACTHYMVADGHARPEIESWDVRHIPLPVEHNNNGNTPRAIGSLDAVGDGFDAIAYLDADNWFDPDHIANLIALQKETGADLVSSGRVIHAVDGSVLMPDGEPGDGERHADTSAVMVMASGFSLVPIWALMPEEMSPNCDRVFFQAALNIGLNHKHSDRRTMHFTSRYGPHYRAAGLPVPPEAVGMDGMKVSEDFVRHMMALGCKNVMTREAVNNVVSKMDARPIIVAILADENALAPDEKALVDGIEDHLGDQAAFYFTSPEELVADSNITRNKLNVFLMVFESRVENWQSLEELIESRADVRLLYVRSSDTNVNSNVDTLIDRRATNVFVGSEALREAYHQNNRYGAGHVVVAQTVREIVNSCKHLIHRHTLIESLTD